MKVKVRRVPQTKIEKKKASNKDTAYQEFKVKKSIWDDKFKPAFVAREAVALKKWAHETKIPLPSKFAAERGYSNSIILQFCEKSEEFNEAYEYAKTVLEARVAEGGLKGTYENGMSVFTLKQLGWTDKKEIKATVGVHAVHQLVRDVNAEVEALEERGYSE